MSANPVTPLSEPLTEVHAPLDPWSDPFALAVIKRDFEAAANYRHSNHDWRWRNADELYLAWVATKYWDGTRIPRSNLGVYLAFEQIESVLPRIISTLFSDFPWFQTLPRPGTTPQQARDVLDLIMWQLDGEPDEPQSRIRENFRRAAKSACIYGNGICEVGYEEFQRERKVWKATQVPKKKTFPHPILGPVRVPTGETERRVKWQTVTDEISRPFVRYRSIKDFYIDPNCPSPIVQEARFACLRSWMTVDELDAKRNEDGFNIPDRKTLHDLSKTKPSTQADMTKAATESMRLVSYNPAIDYSSDPGAGRLEVISYHTKERLCWMLNREYLIYNESHPYGFISFYNTHYVDVLDRFYSLAITDVTEGEQRFQERIINGRSDELSLTLHPSTIKRQGVTIHSFSLRKRPGAIIEVPNPKEDIIREEVSNITQSAYIEVQASDIRAQKTTGITDLAMMGTPTAGGNSANRTATGVNTQSQASSSRIQYIIENMEDIFAEPILGAVHQLNRQLLDPQHIIDIVNSAGNQVQIDPVSILNANVKFTLGASAKMQARQAILQAFPLLAQTFLNPAFLSALAQQQQETIDISEWAAILLDAINYRSRISLFRKLTPQEQQAMNQPPADSAIKLQMQKDRLAAQAEHGEDKNLTDVVRQIIASSPHLLKNAETSEMEEGE